MRLLYLCKCKSICRVFFICMQWSHLVRQNNLIIVKRYCSGFFYPFHMGSKSFWFCMPLEDHLSVVKDNEIMQGGLSFFTFCFRPNVLPIIHPLFRNCHTVKEILYSLFHELLISIAWCLFPWSFFKMFYFLSWWKKLHVSPLVLL